MKIQLSQNQRRQPGDRGFTLVEVLCAILVTMVGLLSVAHLFLVAIINNHSSRQTTLATILVQRKLEHLLAVPLTNPQVQYKGNLDDNGKLVDGYSETYYVDHDRANYKGTGRVSETPFYEGQSGSYVLTWVVQADSATTPLPGLRRITVRAEVVRAAMQGMGQGSESAEQESAQIDTIRTPSQ